MRPLTEALANVTNVTSQNNVKSFITAAIPFLTAEKSGSIPADSGPPPLPSPPTVLPSVAGQVGRSRWRHRQQVSATGCAGQRRQRLGPPGNEGGEGGGGGGSNVAELANCGNAGCCIIRELLPVADNSLTSADDASKSEPPSHFLPLLPPPNYPTPRRLNYRYGGLTIDWGTETGTRR